MRGMGPCKLPSLAWPPQRDCGGQGQGFQTRSKGYAPWARERVVVAQTPKRHRRHRTAEKGGKPRLGGRSGMGMRHAQILLSTGIMKSDTCPRLGTRARGPRRAPRAYAGSFLACVGDPPDPAGAIIGHQQRAVLGYGHACRAAPHVALLGHESHEKVLIFAVRLALLHRHADDFVADAAGTVPRAVLGGKGVVVVSAGKSLAVIERQVDRGRGRLQEHIGNNDLILQFRPLARVPRIWVRA
jgi:hypothetical protein